MVFERNVANDVVVDEGVALRPEVPWLFFWVVGPVLEAGELVFEVQDVECLLVAECTIFVLREHVDEFLLLEFTGLFFFLRICVNLRYGIVTGLLRFDSLVRDFDVRWRDALELRLLIDVLCHVSAPRILLIGAGQEHFVGLGVLELAAEGRHFISLFHFSYGFLFYYCI